MSKLNREEFLQQLRSLEPGLSPKETVEQSSCFVFKDGTIMTYNGQIACSRPTKLSFEGAVKAVSLVNLLDKMTEKSIGVEPADNELVVTGKRKQAGVPMEAEIELPFAQVEVPTKWKPLEEGFADAIDMVRVCAGNDETEFAVTCVNITPKRIEACDNVQLIRYRIKTGVEKPVLIRHQAAKYVKELGMLEYSQTESWMHFRNSDKVVLSCRTFIHDYPDLGQHLEVEGSPIVLPKGMQDVVDKAQEFLSQKSEDNELEIYIKPGKMKVTSSSIKGWYKEYRDVNYKGKPIKFNIPPKLLIDITEKYNEATISSERLKVKGECFTYVTSLGIDEGESDNGKEDTEESED